MTPREWAEEIDKSYLAHCEFRVRSDLMRDYVERIIGDALAEERERCAQKCDAAAQRWRKATKDNAGNLHKNFACNGRALEAKDLAKAIRTKSSDE